MIKSVEGMKVFRGKDVLPAPLASPRSHQREPFRTVDVIVSDTTVPLSDAGEKPGVVFYSDREEIIISKIILGPGGGEVWHTHQSSAEVFKYLSRGSLTVSWEEAGQVYETVMKPGDFLHIAAGARQQWINEGDEDVEIVCISHSHSKLREKPAR